MKIGKHIYLGISYSQKYKRTSLTLKAETEPETEPYFSLFLVPKLDRTSAST